MTRKLGTALVALSLTALPMAESLACSRVVWSDTGRGVYVGRNMDWFEDMESNIWVLPRGMQRDGLAPVNPIRWTSKYGSLAITGDLP